MKVPFLDLKAQYQSIKNEITKALQEVVESTAFAGGPFVKEFEDAFARYCRCRHAIGVGSGTDALWAALLALGVRPGDEVITVPNTFIATAEAISFCGAQPVFVDIDKHTYTMDPALLEKAITPRTKAIIPVHLYGQMADMDPIMHIAKAEGISVIEDACQAHGAEYKGRRAGSLGDAGCFSFYPGKNLGAYGEAGAVVTNRDDVADTIRIFRDHGQQRKYHHAIIGWNGRMDGMQGAVLSVKLKYLDGWNDARRSNAHYYTKMLNSADGITLPVEADYGTHVYHIYPLLTANRDRLITSLTEHGIGCGIHYPVPVHLTEAYASLGYKRGDFPMSEDCAEKLISLPMFAELSTEQIDTVAAAVRQCVCN